MPEINEDVEVEIAPEDIKMDVYRASGAGGQKVNKTSSAVRLTHIPTGIVVSCQVERSQHQNREVAMKMLASKLMEIKEREHLDKISDIKGVQKEIGWGSQIRSYVFMPYTLAKDHRTNYEMGNINAVMDGDIDGFINAYLKQESLNSLVKKTIKRPVGVMRSANAFRPAAYRMLKKVRRIIPPYRFLSAGRSKKTWRHQSRIPKPLLGIRQRITVV